MQTWAIDFDTLDNKTFVIFPPHLLLEPLSVCVCVCVRVCVCVLSFLQHRGAVKYYLRSAGLCWCPDRCAEERKGDKEVKSMAS